MATEGEIPGVANDTGRAVPAPVAGVRARGTAWRRFRRHVPAMVGLAILGGYLLKRPSPDLRLLAPIAKGVHIGCPL